MQMTNVNIGTQLEIPCFAELRRSIPLSGTAAKLVAKTRRDVRAIIKGRDKRILMPVGPCSIHNISGAIKFAKKLAPLIKRYEKTHVILMRVCLEKPRTGEGWFGLLVDPYLDDSWDMVAGVVLGRQLMVDILELGVPIACEVLDHNLYNNSISDLTSYTWIGARTVSHPYLRKAASGFTSPVGIKNSNTEDALDSATHAIGMVAKPSFFPGTNDFGRLSRTPTKGNRYGHLILRGNRSGPNYSAKHVYEAREALRKKGLNDRVLIDCSHGNCAGDYQKQVDVFLEVMERISQGEKGIIGLMLEVNLEGDKQKVIVGVPGVKADKLLPGQSVTDACIPFDDLVRFCLGEGSRILAA